jgi:ribosome production factor 2
MHFSSELFDTHPRFIQLKSLLLDFFNGEVIDSICLAGLNHIISVTLGPTPSDLTTTTPGAASSASTGSLPKIHIRTYTLRLLSSGVKTPRVELTPMGPNLDLILRRHQDADPDMLKAALKKPKLKKQDVEKGLGKKRKNMEVDEMGDLRGRIHVAKQDLSQLQRKKVKGLRGSDPAGDGDSASGASGEEDEEPEGPSRKRRKL